MNSDIEQEQLWLEKSKFNQYKPNPNPQQAYQITAKINPDIPGVIHLENAAVLYTSLNCEYKLIEDIDMVEHPEFIILIDYQETSDNTYVGTVYLDGMLDEDYFGNNICHWELVKLAIAFRSGESGQSFSNDDEMGPTRFVAELELPEIIAEKSITIYYPKILYPDSAFVELGYFGEQNLSNFVNFTENDCFSITITAKKIQLKDGINCYLVKDSYQQSNKIFLQLSKYFL